MTEDEAFFPRRQDKKVFDPRSQSALYKGIVLFLISWVTVGATFAFDSMGALEHYVLKEYKLSNAEFGLTYTLYSVPNIVLPAFGGLFLTRVGVATGAVILVVIQCLGAALVAVSATDRSYPLLLIGRLLFGVGSESAYIAQNTMCIEWFATGNLSSAMAMTATLGRVGSVLVFNILPIVAERTGSLQAALWVAFCVVLSSLGATLMYIAMSTHAGLHDTKVISVRTVNKYARVREEDGSEDEHGEVHHHSQEDHLDFASTVRSFNASYWTLLAVVVFFYAGLFPFTAISTQKFMEHYGLPISAASGYTSLLIFSSLVGGPIFGLVVDHCQEHAPAITAFSAALTLPAFLVLGFTSLTPLVPMLLLGVSFAIFTSAAWPPFSVIVPREHNATAVGIVTAFQNALYALLNYTTGVVADETSYRTLMIYFLGLSAVSTLATLLWCIIDARHPEHRLDKLQEMLAVRTTSVPEE